MTINEAIELAVAYRDYNIREFNQCEVPTIDDSGIWGVMYTTTEYNDEDFEHDLQVDLDYINKRFLYYVDDELLGVDELGDIPTRALADIISELDWDSLYSECNHYGRMKYERED